MSLNRSFPLKTHPFTLPELFLVLAVAALHAALLAPTLGTLREEARRSQCASNLRSVGSALRGYEDEHRTMPNADTGSESFRLLLEGGYLPERELLSCPSNPVYVDPELSSKAVSYYIDPQTPRERHPMRAVVADRNLDGDWTDNHGEDGVNVLFGGEMVGFVGAGEGTGVPPDPEKIGNPHIEKDSNIYGGLLFAADPKIAVIGYSYSLTYEKVTDPGLHTWNSGNNMAAVIILVGGGGGGGGGGGYVMDDPPTVSGGAGHSGAVYIITAD